MPTVREIKEATESFFDLTHNPSFSKTLRLNKLGERKLLPMFGAFLHGRFGRVERELTVRGRNGNGRVDFKVHDVAVELAVRKPKAPTASLSVAVNSDEVYKLLRYEGVAVLVLLDYSKHAFKLEDLENFRNWPSLGRGNFNISAFNVVYCYREGGVTRSFHINIRT